MASRVSRFLCLLAAVAASSFSVLPAQTQFAQPKLVPTAVWPHTFYVGDFDGDGHRDLLYLQYQANALATQTDTSIYITYGDGKGGFSTPVIQGSVNSRGGLTTAVADVDGDGISDFVFVQGPIAPSTQSLYTVWFGTAQRTIRDAPPPASAWLPLGSKPPNYTSVLPVSLGSATKLGLVVQDSANQSAEVMQNDSTGRFSPTYTFPLPDGVGPMAAYDLNGDGHQDLVVLGLSGHTVDVFLGTSNNPIYQAPVRYAFPAGAQSMLLTDVDNDSHPDLVIEGINGRFDIYHGNSDGTFSTQSEGGSGTLDGTTGNGGHLIGETTLANGTRHNFIAATPAGISVLVGQGNLSYVLQGVYNAGPGRSSYALADFNGDGNLDLAVDSPEGIAILYGNADGSFQSGRAFPTMLPATSGALAGFTKSGNLDLAAGLSSMDAQVLLGQGDGSFVPVSGAGTPQSVGFSPLPPAGLWGQVVAADFDGDGQPDLSMAIDGPSLTPAPWSNPYSLWTLLNAGTNDGRFTTPLTLTLDPAVLAVYPRAYLGTATTGAFGGTASLTSIAHYDGLLWEELEVAPLSNSILRGPGFGSDAVGVVYSADLHAHNLIASGDLTHDGLPDYVVQHNGLLSVYLSRPNNAPQLVSTTVPVAPYVSSTWGGISQTYNEPAFPGSMAIADLNGDGFGDLVVAYDDMGADHTQPTAARPNHILIWLGNGDGTFKGPATIQPTRNFYQIALADLNGDGHPDLVMHDGYVLSVQYGKGDGTFGAEQHYLAGMGLNTISAGDLNHDGKVDLVVANGGTFFGNPVANHEAPVVNPEVNSGGVTVLLNTQAATLPAATGTLTVTPNPVAYNGDFTVTIALNGTPAPTGTVTLTIDGAPPASSSVSTGTLGNGAVTLSFPASTFTTPLTPGAHTLVAVYGGDASYTGVTLNGTLTVGLAPTSVTLTPTTPLQVYFGQGIDGLFSVIATFPITGTYTVLDNGVPTAICTNLPFTVNGVRNDCPYGNPVLLDAGPHALSVAYNGDSGNAPSVSPSIPYVVLPDLTTASLTSALNPSTSGQSVTFTATVAGNAAVPVGPVIFMDGATPIGTGTLNAAGIASFTTNSLTIGTHPIRAAYAGTIDFNPVTSGVVNQVVNPPVTPLTTAIQLNSSLNPAPSGFGVIFTATVETTGNFPVVPTGTVSFLDGGAVIGTGTLNNLGVATFTTSTLAVGSHAMTASYAGQTGSFGGLPPPSPPKPPVQPRAASANSSPTLLASVSSVLTQVITTPLKTSPASFSVSVTPDPVYTPAGQDAVLAVRVAVQGNFTQTVQLSCSGLPAEASCVFVNPVIGSAGGTTTLYVLPQGPHGCGTNGAPYYGLLGLFGLAFVRRRRRLGLLLALVCLFGLVGLSGCGSGNCTDLGVIPGNYNFTVTGTPSAGPVTGAQGWIVGMKVLLP